MAAGSQWFAMSTVFLAPVSNTQSTGTGENSQLEGVRLTSPRSMPFKQHQAASPTAVSVTMLPLHSSQSSG